jgi:branched-chain amino acid transport system permease protein
VTTPVSTETVPVPAPAVAGQRRRSGVVTGRGGTAATVVVAAVGVVLPFMITSYWLSTAVFVLIAAIGALGLDVLTGRTGQISLGHAFFLAVGAYTGGVIGGRYGVTAAVWIPAAAVVAGILGGVIGPTALRLRGLYLAIVTIGLLFIGQHIFTNVSFLSGGPGGEALPVPTFGGLNFANGVRLGGLSINRSGLYYYLAFILLAACMIFVRNFGKGAPGRAMYAVRDRELAAAVLGVDVARTKVAAFVVSSMLAGISGALYGSYLGFVVPTQWDIGVSIQYVVMIVVGGMATIWGPLLGAAFVIGLPSLLQDVSGSLPFLATGANPDGVMTVSDASAIVYGVFLVIFLLAEPGGVVGLGRRVAAAVRTAGLRRKANTNKPRQGGAHAS